MDPKDLYNLKKNINAIAESFKNKEKFVAAPLASRLIQATTENPGDQTIAMMAAFLRKKANKSFFITREELKDLYNKFYVSSTRCAEYLMNELDVVKLAEPKKASTEEYKEIENLADKYADPNLVSALNSVFGSDNIYRPYSEELAKKAVTCCLRELNKFDFKPKKVSVAHGSEDVLLCQVTYETPKGSTNVIVPVEYMDNKVFLPSVFVAGGKFSSLSSDLLKDYIKSTVGKYVKANVDNILRAIKIAKHGEEKQLSDVERIVLKASVHKETPSYDPNSILCQTLDKPDMGVEAKANDEDIKSFANKLNTRAGQAEFLFSQEAVDKGRRLVEKTAKNYGVSDVQVNIGSFNDDTVFYVVAVPGGPGFKVPVKFSNKLPVLPSVIMANGKIASFNREGVNKLLLENDNKLSANTSQLSACKPSELLEIISEAIVEKDYDKAEDALNVLSVYGDEQTFKYAFSVYNDGLKENLLKKSASSEIKCSKQASSPNSKYVLCGHTGLPLHMVCQDEYGNCQPKYRKHMDKTAEGGSFMHSSVYLKG